jgi:hypothetical protein
MARIAASFKEAAASLRFVLLQDDAGAVAVTHAFKF